MCAPAWIPPPDSGNMIRISMGMNSAMPPSKLFTTSHRIAPRSSHESTLWIMCCGQSVNNQYIPHIFLVVSIRNGFPGVISSR